MWRDNIYDMRPYAVASLEFSGDDTRKCPTAQNQEMESNYANFITDYQELFQGQITESMMSDGLHQVADPLIRYGRLLQSGDFTDLIFLVGKQEEVTIFEAHKFPLITASPVFYTMFYGELPEGDVVRIPDVTPAAFQLMLEYIYCGLLPRTMSAPLGIATLYVARKYMVDRLEEIVVLILSSCILIEEAFLLFEASFFFDLPPLTRVTRDFIDVHIQELVTCPEWLDVDMGTMLKVIQSDNLKITEIDLFQALVKWSGLGDPCWKKGKSLGRLSACFPHIRFPTMSSNEFANGPAKFMSKEDIANILLHICTTVGVKPSCGFCTTPRNYTAQVQVKKEPNCECTQKGLNCFYCAGLSGNSGQGPLTGRIQGRPVSRRSTAIGTPIPPCYCACRTRANCPGRQLAMGSGEWTSNGLGIMEETQPSLVSSPATPRRPIRLQAPARPNPQEAHNIRTPRNRPGWRV